MHLSESDIRHLADLARLHVSDEEATRLSHDLTEIVRFIDEAADVDVSDAKPMTTPTDADGTTRGDVAEFRGVGRSSDQAAQTEDGFVRVSPALGPRGPRRSDASEDEASE